MIAKDTVLPKYSLAFIIYTLVYLYLEQDAQMSAQNTIETSFGQ